MDLRSEAAEFVGAFFLVFVGCGALALGTLDGLGVALCFGGTIAVMVYALAPISGAHLNPAVTLAFAATRHFPWSRVPSYLTAQAAGALAAAALLALLGMHLGPAVTRLAPGTTLAAGAVWETAATFLLAFTIVAVATDLRIPRPATGLAIGGAVTLGALAAGPITGGSMNPARSLGPALIAGDTTLIGLYVAAPILGALVAMGLHRLLRPANPPHVASRPQRARAPAPTEALKPGQHQGES